MKRWLALMAAASMLTAVQAAELPDFGSPADAALSKTREAQIGRGVMLQLRNAGVVVDDPFLEAYLTSVGSQLATHVNNGDFDFNGVVNTPDFTVLAANFGMSLPSAADFAPLATSDVWGQLFARERVDERGFGLLEAPD